MRTVTTTEAVADALVARYGWQFFFDPATTPPFATVQCGPGLGGADHFWASCPRCWWWDEDDGDRNPIFTAAEAQVLADAHNRIHHNDRSRP